MINMPFSSNDSKQHFPYLKKHLKTSKISRVKLHQEFACKGWDTACHQFQTVSGENECDIVSSPTKYEPSHLRQYNSKMRSNLKPRLVEISNINSVFKENKLKPSFKKIVRKPPEKLNGFVQKVFESKKTKDCDNKKAKSELLKLRGFQATFQLKQITDPNQRICFNESSKKILENSFIQKRIESKLDSQNKVECYSVSDSSPKVLCASIQSIKKEGIKNSNFSFSQNHSQKQKPQSFNKDPHTFFSLDEQHGNQFIPPSSPNFTFDSCLNDPSKISLNNSINSKNVLEAFRNSFIEEKCGNKNSDPEINIDEECSPASATHSEERKNSLSNLGSKENHSSKPIVKFSNPKRLSSEAFNIQNLQSSFQVNKKHCSESNPSDNYADLITDNSPIKPSFDKQLYLKNSNKFKNLTEEFGSNVIGDCDVNTSTNSDILIKDDSSPAKPTVISCPSGFVSSFRDNVTSDLLSTKETSVEGKSTICDNKVFKKTVQCSFQDKSLADKGTSWLQALNWDDYSQSKSSNKESHDQIEKKTLKNILPGGFAEQMLKVQRRERSDRVIWSHKMNELKKKVADKSITFTLMSFIHFGQFIFTKCTSESDNECMRNTLCNESDHFNVLPTIQDQLLKISSCDTTLENGKTVLILFKKNMFSKLHLEIGDMFALFPPWQKLCVPSLPFPVILCTYFIDVIHKSKDVNHSELQVCSSFPEQCDCEKDFSNTQLFESLDSYGKPACISARVQRIWETGITCSKLQDVLKYMDYNSFSVLLQTQDNMIVELKIDSAHLLDLYREFLLNAEGKCFRFCNIIISHRYNLHKCSKLSQIIKFMQDQSSKSETVPMPYSYCYQFIPSCDKIPSEISDENFPVYYSFEIHPLSFFQKNKLGGVRVSCIGKVLFQNKEDFYITDESLLSSKKKKYYKLKVYSPCKKSKQSIVGAVVLVKEAELDEDCLIIDEFSRYEVIFDVGASKFKTSHTSRLKKISLITFENVLSPLTLSSKLKEVIFVEGIISQVDDNTAMSWLECSFCYRENLLEDSNSVIYCEDCSCIVPKPVLNVKMEVVIRSSLVHSKVKIKLLSPTIKRILRISEDNYQPECNISDVLGKNTGILCCYIKNIEVSNEAKLFHLAEVRSS